MVDDAVSYPLTWRHLPAGGLPPTAYRTLQLTLLLTLLLTAGGCATHANQLSAVRQQFYGGNLAEAASQLDKRLAKHDRQAEALMLERSMVELFSGEPRQAEQTLRQVRDRFDYLEQQSLGEEALSLMSDDNRRAYAGEDYEKILVRAFLALANLMGDGQDAAAYGWQVAEKQQQLLARSGEFPASVAVPPTGNAADPNDASVARDPHVPEVAQAPEGLPDANVAPAYPRVALGAYIQAMLREQTHANYDDVARARAMVVGWQPDFAYGLADLQRARGGRHSQRGHGVVYVFGLVGRGPYKIEAVEIPSTAALAIADQVLSNNSQYRLPPTLAPVKVPQLVRTANRIRHLEVAVDDRPCTQTATITDVGGLAVQQYDAVYPRVVARAVVRRVVKKGVVAAGQQQLDAGDSGLSRLALDLAGVAWEASEAADTRCWGLLPDKIQVARLELPVGQFRLALTPWGDSAAIGPPQEVPVEVRDGRDTYVLAYFPDDRPVGQVLVGPRP